MNLADYLDELDPKLAANLQRAVDAIRGEFEERIESAVRAEVSAAAAQAAARGPASPVEDDTLAAPAAFFLDAADELRLAAIDIDQASSQSEILEALTRGVLRFSSRVAIFVNRGPEVHGWSASGFGKADAGIKEISLSGDLPFPIGSRLSEGAVALSAADCAMICDALGAERSSMGLLLPFVLGSQVVGTVYCDRTGNEGFSVAALQLLTYLAGQTLETLPVRKREATATLSLARGSVDPGSTAPSPAPAVGEKVEASTPAPLAAEPELEPESVSESSEFRIAPEPEDDFELEPPVPELEPPSPSALEDDLEPLAAIDEESTRPGILEPAPAPAAAPTPPPAPAPKPTAAPAATPAPTNAASQSLDPVAEPAIGLSSTQVAPPADLEGPGWAFTGGGETSEANSESEHEQAQRLARLLVTEIKLYNEEAVEQGRQDGDVYSRLREDIDRSRQIFEDRIDPAVRAENDYFKQALVRILAGGDPTLLGI